MSSPIQEQQFQYVIVKDSITISDSTAFIPRPDSVYLFYKPIHLSPADSIYQELINPLSKKTNQSGDYGFIPKAKADYIPNWNIGIILFLLILLATIRSASGTYLGQLFQSAFNRKIALRLFREKVNTMFNISFRLDSFFILVVGLFIYQVVDHFAAFSSEEQLLYCGIIVGAFAVYVTGKFLTYRICGAIFDTTPETQEYIFHAKAGNKIIGIILFPIVLFLFITKGNFSDFLVYTGIILTIILYTVNILRSIVIIAQKVFPLYYLILYLCTLEILPLLLVGKILLIM